MAHKHTITQGESVVTVAEEHGFFALTIWDDAQNKDLRRKRKEMHVLMPGDELFIPDKRLKEIPIDAGKRHTFRRKGVPAVLKLRIFEDETPRANQSFVLLVDGERRTGVTDDEGVLMVHVPTQAREGLLTIGPDERRFQIKFGHVDPLGELSGVQKRLNNLGFECPEDGEPGAETRAAIRRFQRRFSLPETGETDEATTTKLSEQFDSLDRFPVQP
jgi:putative peptidoglycan binding protein